jgi:hypothetical protein
LVQVAALGIVVSDVLFVCASTASALELYPAELAQRKPIVALVVVLAFVLLPIGARILLAAAYLVWLHGAFGRALALSGDRALLSRLPARSAVVLSVTPLVSAVSGLIVVWDLDALSRGSSVSARAWWVDAWWWWGTTLSIWAEVGVFLGWGRLPSTTLGFLLLAAIATRWAAIPAMISFVRRIERLQRERVTARDWAAAF